MGAYWSRNSIPLFAAYADPAKRAASALRAIVRARGASALSRPLGQSASTLPGKSPRGRLLFLTSVSFAEGHASPALVFVNLPMPAAVEFPAASAGVFELAPAERGLAPLPEHQPVLQDEAPLAAWVVAPGCLARVGSVSAVRPEAAGSWHGSLGFYGAKSSAHVWVPVQSFSPLLHQQWCVYAFDM